MRLLESILNNRKNNGVTNTSIILGVSVYVIVFVLAARFCFGEEQADNTMQYGPLTPVHNRPETIDDKISDRIIDMNGVVGIDGSLRVLETTYTKIFDLVEISTPVTPAANHARIFLTPGTGSKQQISVIFDDGTTAKMASN
jgi:hypothetical protein